MLVARSGAKILATDTMAERRGAVPEIRRRSRHSIHGKSEFDVASP